MSELFKDSISFNENIRRWDISNVTTMENMFNNAAAFQQNITNWDITTGRDTLFQGRTSVRVLNVNVDNMFYNAPLTARLIFAYNILPDGTPTYWDYEPPVFP